VDPPFFVQLFPQFAAELFLTSELFLDKKGGHPVTGRMAIGEQSNDRKFFRLLSHGISARGTTFFEIAV
jgi:hypothetical protein